MEIADDDIDFESRVGELLERGLERYGDGDLEGALSDWKHVLVLDPDNEKAAHYSSYVEDNHDLAESGSTARFDPDAELDYPFGLEELGLAKMREDELDDYESFELVESKKKKAESKAAKKSDTKDTTRFKKNAVASTVDEGWNVDEGWVSDLVQQTESLFAPENAEDAEDAEDAKDAKDEEPAEEAREAQKPASVEEAFAGLDLELPEEASADAEEDEDSVELGAAGAGASEEGLPGIDELELDDSLDLDLPSLPSEQHKLQLEADDDEEEEDDGDYAEMEIGEAADEVFIPGDEDRTGQHIALPEEDLDGRAPTQDPDLSSVPVRVDEALLSLEDSTREIQIGDSVSKRSPSSAGIVFEAKEDDDLASADEGGAAGIDDHDELMDAIKAAAPSGDDNERTAFIVSKLIQHALGQHDKGKNDSASTSVGEALAQADDCAAAQKLVFAKESELVAVLMAGLCEPSQVPSLVVPLTDIPLDEIDNRAAFLLTRVDGVLSLEEILVISGMSKLEALRHLSRMHQREYLSVS